MLLKASFEPCIVTAQGAIYSLQHLLKPICNTKFLEHDYGDLAFSPRDSKLKVRTHIGLFQLFQLAAPRNNPDNPVLFQAPNVTLSLVEDL